jgi:Mce-associated membrane protein
MPKGPSFQPAAEPESPAVSAMTEVAETESLAADASPPQEKAGVAEGASTGLPERTGARPRWQRVLPAIFGAATVLLGALGSWAAVAAHDLRDSTGAANGAVVDASATHAVTQQVTSAVNTIFSYSYADTARTRTAAQRLLTGPAIRQYNQLFALVEQDAPKEKLVVTTRVTSIGVELLTVGRARLLVFANQQDTMTGTGKSSYGGAMFAVTAVSQHGTWKIENIDTFTGST